MKKILFFLGSQRVGSFNKVAGDYIMSQLEGRAQGAYLDYSKIPFFNQDIEFPTPEAVQEVRDIVGAYDGIWILSPEYNGAIPGVLKNTLDWVSRPLKKGEQGPPSIVKDKPVAISSVGPREGSGVRPQLEALMNKMALKLMEGSVGIPLPKESFVTGEFTLDEEAKKNLDDQVNRFIEFLG